MTTLSPRQRRISFILAACVAAYGAVLLALNHTVKSEHLWGELLESPRSRTDFTVLTATYVLLSAALAFLACWRPEEAPVKWLRLSLVGLTFLAAVGSTLLLVVVVVNLDWKMSL